MKIRSWKITYRNGDTGFVTGDRMAVHDGILMVFLKEDSSSPSKTVFQIPAHQVWKWVPISED